MSARIIMLDEDTIGKIAAGEVVERPASAVKELIENSIDAGADSVEVEIDRSGHNLIRVADNGSGMGKEDVGMAFKRHATSKIRGITDLGNITTLGFRGEALASIAAVSQIDIVTKRAEDPAGIYMYVESGVVQRERPAARDRGTTIEVRNLFYNVPARKKFMKRESTEVSGIIDVFSDFVLSRPDISFRLIHGGRTLIEAPKGLDTLSRVGMIMGEDVPKAMTPISLSEEGIVVEGFVSVPSFTKKDKRGQFFFVNGRSVRSRVLGDAVYSSYRSLLERGRYPWGLLFITIDPGRIDVNVHPSKTEIKFESENEVKGLISRAVKKSFEDLKNADIKVFSGEGSAYPAAIKKESDVLSESIAGEQILSSPQEQAEFDYGVNSARTGGLGSVGSWGAVAEVFHSQGNGHLRLFQLGLSYIVRVTREELMITDQHAAHERVLYELFSKTLNGSSLEKQTLLFPLRIDLSPSESAVMRQIVPGLSRLGFEIDAFGEKSFVIRSVPAAIKPDQLETAVKDVISDLAHTGSGEMECMEELVKLVSCRSAVKAGDMMSCQEMSDLLTQLESCELPFTCPHGRPTTIGISLKELEKRFRRS